MKIEIGESLLLSWLRHVKNCQLVQTNWKPSLSSWEMYNEAEAEELMAYCDKYFKDMHNIDIFKNNASYMQLLRQAEVDIMGVSFSSDNSKELYGIDVAFHEGGLNYGDKDKTISNVLKKIIRTAMAFIVFLNSTQGQIIFAAPKINNAEFTALAPLLNELQQIFDDRNYSFKIFIYCNEDFNNKVLQPVIAVSESVADTSELFMRSLQLYNMFATEASMGDNRAAAKTLRLEKIQVENREGFTEMKIGMMVRSTLRRLFAEEKIPDDEIERMQTYDYSKEVFNINYPILKKVDNTNPINIQRLVNDRPRYWNELFSANGKQYLVCQEWFEYNNRAYFIRWLEGIDRQ